MHATFGRMERLARGVGRPDEVQRGDAVRALLRPGLHHLLVVRLVLGPDGHHRIRLPLHILQGGVTSDPMSRLQKPESFLTALCL